MLNKYCKNGEKNPKTIYKVDLTMENMNPPKISSFYAEFDPIEYIQRYFLKSTVF